MEEKLKTESIDNSNILNQEEETSSFDLKTIFTLVVLNWQWFVLSMLIFFFSSLLYLRYFADPVYQMSVKILIKDEQSNRSRGNQMLANMQDFGFMTNSAGIDNEIEILGSKRLAREVVKDLKLNISYSSKGRIKETMVYKYQPINVDLDPESMKRLDLLPKNNTISLRIEKAGKKYTVSSTNKEMPFEGTLDSLPAMLKTPYGTLMFTENTLLAERMAQLGIDVSKKDSLAEDEDEEEDDEEVLFAKIEPIEATAARFLAKTSIEPTSKLTTIARITVKDQHPLRASDYLEQLVVCYNRQANADKNEIAFKTETFINERLEKINTELGLTEGQLENYKKKNSIVQLRLDAPQFLTQVNQYTDQLSQANTQIQLLDYLREYVQSPANKYQLIPSNVGLTDGVSASLISSYNKTVLDRNSMLEAASENSPQVLTLTNTLDHLQVSINDALLQARKAADISRQGIQQQYNVYQSKVAASPEQERILTQIGRQQEVKSGLYLMLLQKREENSISLAATADKGKLIDDPLFGGKVSPKSSIIILVAIVLGFGLPLLITFLIQILRFKIEGHGDVARLTNLPIVADIAIANEKAKTTAGIVVHENKNDQTDEMFRSLRTNIQFMLKEEEKVILFTSSTSGEGKTFNAANLAVSFALLGKKTILVGLDIRKPALGRLFEIADRKNGITTLLVKDQVRIDDLMSQVVPSGVNPNLDLLLAGPTPPNPTELLSRESLSQIMSILRENYDYIILDTAPVGLVSDTLQIGRYADVSVFVCRADYTPKSSFGLVNTLAAEKKMSNMCVLINGIDMSKKKYGYYYGYGAYGKYGRFAYGRYGRYGYGNYGNYGSYGNYQESHYSNKNDDSIKK